MKTIMRMRRKFLLFFLFAFIAFIFLTSWHHHRLKDDAVDDSLSCAPIHIATVCAGHRSPRQLVTLLKSILFYRTRPLHLHLVVDDVSHHILTNLFRTWGLPDFVVSFYPDNRLRPQVKWIANSHYSGIYGLLKLKLAEVLWGEVNEVIVLDTDLIFTRDISLLHHHFTQFTTKQCLGLVENLSEWYMGEGEGVWEAVGRGFNTGVMLMKVGCMRDVGWEELWPRVARGQLIKHKMTQLADQDVVNAVIAEKPNLLHTLPCEWNLQLSNNMRAELCPLRGKGAGVYHWNSPDKQESRNGRAHGAGKLYERFVNMNGAFVKEGVVGCGDEVRTVVKDDDDVCEKVIESTSLHRIHLYYLPFDRSSVDVNDVTLVVQLSVDRLGAFEKLCEKWPGPISAAIFTSDEDAANVEMIMTSQETRGNMGIHLVFHSSHDIFPINLLRNIALQQAFTEFVFLCDVDFLPMPSLGTYLRDTLIGTQPDSLTAYVVPAFESLYYRARVPVNKDELVEMYRRGEVSSFRSEVWEQGHRQTNFTRWFNSHQPYTIEWARDFEPYLVLPRRTCPRYDKRFAGFGWNKVTHVMEVDAAGFTFVVLPQAFILHLPHQASIYLMRYRRHRIYRECLRWYKTDFVKYLRETYKLATPSKYDETID